MGPRETSLNIPTATAPNMNKGSAVLQKDMSLSASVLVNRFRLRSFPVNIAPIGYPDASPMAITKEPSPGTLNKGLIKGSSNTPIKWTTPRPINS